MAQLKIGEVSLPIESGLRLTFPFSSVLPMIRHCSSSRLFFFQALSQTPAHQAGLIGLVPGSPARSLDTMDSQIRQRTLLSALVPMIGRKVLEPLKWHEKAWHQDEFCGGGYCAFPLVGTNEKSFPMPHKPVGNIHWAGTETAQEHPGYIEGAVQSGERAASEVFPLIQPKK